MDQHIITKFFFLWPASPNFQLSPSKKKKAMPTASAWHPAVASKRKKPKHTKLTASSLVVLKPMAL